MEKDVIRITGGVRNKFKDTVTEEVFLTLYLNEKELLTLLCSPDNLKELSAGFLFSAGLIHSAGDIENISVNASKMTSHITTKKKELPHRVLSFHLLSKVREARAFPPEPYRPWSVA